LQDGDVLPYTRFITTRFGNVLGSNGSVIPRFQKQIAAGGPVTVTHPEITRYFMTIPGSVPTGARSQQHGQGRRNLPVRHGQVGKDRGPGQEDDPAVGAHAGQDIQLIFTGLRPGEKLYEELLSDEENTIRRTTRKS
jgi:FlaA1/EpsC-like NDP-sugar epimerase